PNGYVTVGNATINWVTHRIDLAEGEDGAGPVQRVLGYQGLPARFGVVAGSLRPIEEASTGPLARTSAGQALLDRRREMAQEAENNTHDDPLSTDPTASASPAPARSGPRVVGLADLRNAIPPAGPG